MMTRKLDIVLTPYERPAGTVHLLQALDFWVSRLCAQDIKGAEDLIAILAIELEVAVEKEDREQECDCCIEEEPVTTSDEASS
jgi:hypothetical protein